MKTDRTIRQFQRDHILEETGIVGPKEAELLFGTQAVLAQKIGQKVGATKAQISGVTQRIKSKSAGLKTSLMGKLRKRLLSISRRFA